MREKIGKIGRKVRAFFQDFSVITLENLVSNLDRGVSQSVKKTMASPNKLPKGSVFDRLYDTRSYTGVYAERFKGADGRINAHTDLSVLSYVLF